MAQKEFSKHHRRPKSLGGTKYFPLNNLIILKKSEHLAWHHLFGNMSPSEIAFKISKTFLDPDWEFIATKKDP